MTESATAVARSAASRIRETRKGSWLRRRQITQAASSIMAHMVMISLSTIFLVPLFWMLSTSLKTVAQTWVFPPRWIPAPFKWDNYAEVFRLVPFWSFVRNTLVIVLWSTLGQLWSTSLVAYGFARLRFPARDALFMLMIATLMIPYQVTLIPTFILFKTLGWINTYLPLIVPAFTGGAFFIFLVRQYMMTIPIDLDEAARMDGCGYLQVLYRILLPLCKPPLTIVVVYTFMGTWNDFLGPLIYLNDVDKYTIGIGLSLFRGRVGTNWNVLMAAALMAVIPSLVLYFVAQRRLIGGIASVGLKG